MSMRLFLPPRTRYYNTMPIDVLETEEGYLVKADLPGYEKENISVEVDFESIQITAKTEKSDEDLKFLLRERNMGDMKRTLTFPKPIDSTKAGLKFENGVLEITLPLSEEAKPLVLTPGN